MSIYDSETALIVVDLQNDFADPEGSLYVKGGEEVVEGANEAVSEARSHGATVIYTQDWHPESTPHFEKDGGIWPVHCVRDTWGAALHPELQVSGDVVRKGTGGEDGYSGFTVRDPETGEESSTDLGSRLTEQGIKRLVVIGLATDYCVKETALDGSRKGFETTVIADLTRPVEREPGDAERAIEEMERANVRVV